MINSEGEKELKFPLTREQLKTIFGSCIIGYVQLSSGTATIQDSRISSDSFPLSLIRKTIGGTVGNLTITFGAGYATITSSSSSDTSTVWYCIVPYVLTIR